MKELFLVAFFLSVGLKGLPSLSTLGIVAILLLAMPIKSLLYYVFFNGYFYPI